MILEMVWFSEKSMCITKEYLTKEVDIMKQKLIKLSDKNLKLWYEDFYCEPELSSDNIRKKAIEVIEQTLCYETLYERRDVTYFEIRDVTLFITGGMSWGDSPTDIFDTFRLFNELKEIIMEKESE